MQDLDYRYPGQNAVVFSNGSSSPAPVLSNWVYRKQTGYKGKFIKGSNNDYVLAYHSYSGKMLEFLKTEPRPWTRSGDWISTNPAISFPELVPMAQTPLYNRLLDKLNDSTRGSLDLSIDVLEARSTARMLRVTDNVVNYTGDFLKKFGPIRVASSLWLQYTYGVKPLLSSIHGLAEESIRVAWNATRRHRVRVSEIVETNRVDALVDYTGGIIQLTFDTKIPVQRSMSVGVELRDRQFDLSRYSSLNPVSIAWELLPYSFVVDWFVNVGGYLRSAETALLNGNTFRGGNIAERERITYEGMSTINDATRFRQYSIAIDSLLLRRTKLVSYPVPRLPQWDAKLGSSRLLSAASLLGVMLKR